MMLGFFMSFLSWVLRYNTNVLYVWRCLHFSNAHLFQAVKKYICICKLMSFFPTFYLGKKREASEQLKELVSDLSSQFISPPALRTRRKNISNTPILVDELVRKCMIFFVCLFKRAFFLKQCSCLN